MGYTGEYHDAETGFVYLRARYYNPAIGRFISEDPHWNVKNMIYGDEPETDDVDELLTPDYSSIIQSINLYPYCANNPVLLVDPSGEIAEWIVIGVIALSSLVLTGCSIPEYEVPNYGYNSSTGYYGKPASSSSVRHLEGGLSVATSFFDSHTYGYVSEVTYGETIVRTMEDGSVYTFRSTSRDGTPVVDINSKNDYIKSQKIHFVP